MEKEVWEEIFGEFIERMKDELVANNYKTGWTNMSEDQIISMLEEQVEKLVTVIDEKDGLEIVSAECANLANVALIIADWYRLQQEV